MYVCVCVCVCVCLFMYAWLCDCVCVGVVYIVRACVRACVRGSSLWQGDKVGWCVWAVMVTHVSR